MRLGTPSDAGDAVLRDPQGSARSGIIGVVGDYELLEEIARGGMGVVYRARQVSLNRLVAVKVLLAGQFAKDTQRFRREAEVAASLNHPNIVSIHEVGQDGGQPFFSMELIEGRSLAEVGRDQPLPARRAAELTRTIAEAVHFAHGRSLLHRDLKPSNVLVDASGIPHITDFGLAKRLDGDADLTLSGQVLGTPNYMSPEQVNPAGGPCTPASDIYSLGAILYQLLTGRAPFVAETVTQTLRLVAESDPIPPRLLRPGVPRDLETVCLKCLEKEPQRRYASARELADELDRFLHDEPIQARPIGAPAKWMRWCRRKPALALSMGLAAILLFIVAFGSPIALVRIDRARNAAEAAERATQQQLYTALLEQARATVRGGELGQRVRALDAVRRAAAISNSVELRREVFAALALPDLEFEQRLPWPIAFTLRELDPTFERIAVGRGTQAVEIRAISDQRVMATLPALTNRPAHQAEWSADGQFLSIKRDLSDAGERADLEVWNVAREQRVLARHDVSWGAMAFHPSNRWWMAAEPRDHISIWNLATGSLLRRFALSGPVQSVRFSPDGGRFAAVHAVDRNWTVSVFDAGNGSTLASHAFQGAVRPVRWHPNGRWLVIPESSGVVHWMDAADGRIGEIGAHRAEASIATFSPDGDYFLSTGWDREVICWDGRTRRRLFGIPLDSYITQFRADGAACAIVTDSEVQLHKFARPARRELGGHLGTRLRHAAFSPEGRWLAASSDKCAAVWDLTRDASPAIDEAGYEVHFFFTGDGRELFGSRSSTRDSVGYRWRLHPATNPGAPPSIERVPLRQPADFSFLSVHSNRVMFTSQHGSQILDRGEIESGADSDDWMQTAPGLNAISPDGRWLAIFRPFGSSLYVYRLPDGGRVAKLSHAASIADFEFSPAGDEVAICSRTATEFWSTASWQQTRALTNFAGAGLFYSPNGASFWLRRDHYGVLCDTRTLRPLLFLPDGMQPRAISADGRSLAISVDGRRLQVWDLEETRKHLRALGLDWAAE